MVNKLAHPTLTDYWRCPDCGDERAVEASDERQDYYGVICLGNVTCECRGSGNCGCYILTRDRRDMPSTIPHPSPTHWACECGHEDYRQLGEYVRARSGATWRVKPCPYCKRAAMRLTKEQRQ